MRSNADVAPISKQMTIVIGLSVVGLMAFGLAISYYRNILFERQLILMQERNAKLKDDILGDYARLEYYKSEQYKDKYAKQNFAVFRAGEKIMTIQAGDETETLFTPTGEIAPDQRQALYEERLSNIRVIDHWKMFLFSRDAIETLKKAR